MGFTVGAGGSGAIADGAVTADKIADGAVSPEKLDGTGTPGNTTFYRGDGAWGIPAGSDSLLGSATQLSDAQTLTCTLSEAVTDDDYICVSFGFETSAGAQNVRLFLNGQTSETGYQVNGSADTAKIFTSLNASVRAGFIQIAPVAYGGDLLVNGQGVLQGPGATYYYRQLTGLGGITSITLSSDTGQIKAGSSIQVTRLSGVGIQGPQGPAGSPTTFLDGSLSSNAAAATISGITGRKTYTFTARGVSNANTNRIFFTVNGDTTETFTSGRQFVNATSYSPSTDTLLLASTISSGTAFEVHGTVSSVFDGTNTQVYLNCTGYAGGDAFRYLGHKQFSGDVDLTSFSIRSNQANGLKSGFYLKAQEAP